MRARVRAGVMIVAFALLMGAALGTAARPAAAGGTSVVVQVTLSGNGQGYWRSDDGLVNCVRSGGITSGSCKHTYNLSGGAIVWGYTFASETTSCYVSGDMCFTGGSGPVGFLSPGDPDQSIAMTFRLLDPVTITVKRSGTGSGTVKSTPRGINCGTDCKSAYAKTSSFTLKATPKTGSTFSKWTGGPCNGQGATCKFNVASGPYTITAVFTKNATATPAPAITEAPVTAPPVTAPPATPGPTPIKPTPFPSIATVAAQTPAPPPSSAPPTSPAADDGGRSTIVLALGSLLLIILAVGGLYAMRARRGSSSSSG